MLASSCSVLAWTMCGYPKTSIRIGYYNAMINRSSLVTLVTIAVTFLLNLL